MPEHLGVILDRDTRELGDGRLLGGSPRRMMRLSATGRVALAELRDGRVGSPAAGRLARRLTDAGLAHPRPAAAPHSSNVTVVVPVRDRVEQLDRCLASLGSLDCLVVDDGSRHPDAIAEVTRRHRARLLRRGDAGGPGVARNAGLLDVAGELVAFIDSDCIAPPGWVDALAGHFVDPLVGAVAPRIVPARRASSGRYLDGVGMHDLGAREARVQPLGRVSFVPTAALVVRRAALDALAPDSAFDPSLRYGEDVDLVWRLDAAGWRVRYDPTVEVGHDEPTHWRERLARRFHYGSAAAPLASRHPDATAHLVASPASLAVTAGLLTGQPALATLGGVATISGVRRGLRRADASELSAVRLGTTAIVGTWLGVGQYLTQFGLPLLAAGAWRARPSRRAAVAALALAPAVRRWFAEHPRVSLPRYVAGRIADDAAYGVGVYAGCVKERTTAPLRIIVSRRGVRRISE